MRFRCPCHGHEIYIAPKPHDTLDTAFFAECGTCLAAERVGVVDCEGRNRWLTKVAEALDEKGTK